MFIGQQSYLLARQVNNGKDKGARAMKRKTILPVLLAVIFSLPVFSEDQWDWSQLPNFGELRKEIGWSVDFNSLCFLERPIDEMTELMNQEKWSQAISTGQSWLQSCPIDIRVHEYTGICLVKLDRKVEGEHHFAWVNGLMESILESGDGKTPETAYETISIAEEYDALYLFRLKPKKQSLVHGEVLFDMFVTENKDGKEFTIYFNPAAHFDRIDKMLKK